jgi:hypothetical protein
MRSTGPASRYSRRKSTCCSKGLPPSPRPAPSRCPMPSGANPWAQPLAMAPGQTIGVDALRSWCRERLDGEAVPAHWFIVAAIPAMRAARSTVRRSVACWSERALARSRRGCVRAPMLSRSKRQKTRPLRFDRGRHRHGADQRGRGARPDFGTGRADAASKPRGLAWSPAPAGAHRSARKGE